MAVPALDFPALVARAHDLAWPGRRVILGVTGLPGAGSDVLGQALVRRLNTGPAPDAIPVPGAPSDWAAYLPVGDDAAGFRAAAEALTGDIGATVHLPGSAEVGGHIRLVVAVGDWLLSDGDWAHARRRIDEVWWAHLPIADRIARLLAQQDANGLAAGQAREWVAQVAQPRAREIATYVDRADLLIPMGVPTTSPKA